VEYKERIPKGIYKSGERRCHAIYQTRGNLAVGPWCLGIVSGLPTTVHNRPIRCNAFPPDYNDAHGWR
jgi:hypothetical protein